MAMQMVTNQKTGSPLKSYRGARRFYCGAWAPFQWEPSAPEDMLVNSGDSREQAAKLILRCDFVPVHREELNVTGSDELL